jgi:hypothetical protein
MHTLLGRRTSCSTHETPCGAGKREGRCAPVSWCLVQHRFYKVSLDRPFRTRGKNRVHGGYILGVLRRTRSLLSRLCGGLLLRKASRSSVAVRQRTHALSQCKCNQLSPSQANDAQMSCGWTVSDGAQSSIGLQKAHAGMLRYSSLRATRRFRVTDHRVSTLVLPQHSKISPKSS